MTTVAYNKPNIFPIILIGIVLIGTMIGVVYFSTGFVGVDQSTSHGVERHGSGAEIVRKCLDDNGAMEVWANPETDCYAEVAHVKEEGKNDRWGYRILNRLGDAITEFLDDAGSYREVERYLLNRGYMPFE